MAIVKLSNVPLIPQPTDGVCWFVCAQMLYKWQQTAGKGSMIDPMTHEGSKYRYDNNLDWYCGDNGKLADYLQMKKHAINLDFNGINSALATYGPLWTSVQKNWAGNDHGHVVVILGVADTGVLIHDPEPLKVGNTLWLTWDQITKAVNTATVNGADWRHLTAA